jgi:hypothetical protein
MTTSCLLSAAYYKEADMSDKDQKAPFSDNQLFYGALYALISLPGGTRHAARICKAHNMNFPVLTEIVAADENSGTSEEPYLSFFDALYSYMKNGGAPDDPVFDTTRDGIYKPPYLYSGTGERCIELISTGGWSDSKHHRCPKQRPDIDDSFFTPPLEYAVNKSGISRELVRKHVRVFIHDNGQILSPRPRIIQSHKKLTRDFDYPGRPPSRHLPVDLDADHFKGCARVRLKTLFRVVALNPGENVKWVYNSIAGKRTEIEETAEENEIAVITPFDLSYGDLGTPTDRQILTASGPVKSNHIAPKESFAPGYQSHDIEKIEHTGRPGIFRETSRPYYIMDVKIPVSLSYGANIRFAEPGDKIIIKAEGNSAPSVLKQEDLKQGKVSLEYYSPGNRR